MLPPKFKIRKIGLAPKIILPVTGLLIVSVILALFFIDKAVLKVTIDTAKRNSSGLIYQYKSLRKYYTDSVIKKILTKKNSFEVSYDHKIKPNTIPLPATMIHDLSEILIKDKFSGFEVKLYSEFPFPNRSKRTLDAFQKDSIKFFKKKPDGEFYKIQIINGKEVLRYAISDKMQVQACVNCHNTHPETPKKGWKVGDVRGVLEVAVPIDKQLLASKILIADISRKTIFVAFIMVTLLIILITRLINHPVSSLMSSMKRITEKQDYSQRIKVSQYDEVGELSSQFNKMVIAQEGSQKELQEYWATLENQIKERTDELISTQIVLKQRSQERQDLLHLLCHDLKNPISSCISGIDIYKMKRKNIDWLIPKLEKQLNNGIGIIDLVRTMLAIEDNKMLLELSPHNLKELVLQSTSMLEEKFLEKELSLEVSIPDKIFVYVEKISFVNSVCNNALSNAIKFSPKKSTVKVIGSTMDGRAYLSFQDKGVGIPEDLLDIVFDPSKFTTRVGTSGEKGTGFGMPLVKKFIEAYGGNITINSIEQKVDSRNCGTQLNMVLKEDFRVKLEANEELQRFEILLVDEDIVNLGTIEKTLVNIENNYITLASDGLEATYVLMEKKIDLLITDFNMPRMKGDELVKRMREMKIFPHYFDLPVIVFTSMIKEAKKAFEGMDSITFLEKPIQQKELQEVVKKLRKNYNV